MHCDRQTAALVRRAGSLAREMGHSFVGSVHLLLALSEAAGGPGQLLRGLGLESESARALVSLLYGLGDGELPLPQGFTRAARRLLRSAAREARHLGRREVSPMDVLLAAARERHCASMELLHARLIRTTTCVDGCRCDYTICGDQDPYVKEHPEYRDEAGFRRNK